MKIKVWFIRGRGISFVGGKYPDTKKARFICKKLLRLENVKIGKENPIQKFLEIRSREAGKGYKVLFLYEFIKKGKRKNEKR